LQRSNIHFTAETPSFGSSISVHETVREIETKLRAAARNDNPIIRVTRNNREVLLPVAMIGPVEAREVGCS
jgi:hypothetical protein